jgi:hypothetical protein
MIESIAAVLIQLITNGLGIWIIVLALLCFLLLGVYRLVDLSLRNKSVLDQKNLEHKHLLFLKEKDKDREIAEYNRCSLESHGKAIKELTSILTDQQSKHDLLFMKVDNLQEDLIGIMSSQKKQNSLILECKSSIDQRSSLLYMLAETVLPTAEPTVQRLLKSQLTTLKKSEIEDEHH